MRLSDDFKTGTMYAKTVILDETIRSMDFDASRLGLWAQYLAARDAIESLRQGVLNEVKRLAMETGDEGD